MWLGRAFDEPLVDHTSPGALSCTRKFGVIASSNGRVEGFAVWELRHGNESDEKGKRLMKEMILCSKGKKKDGSQREEGEEGM